VAFNASSSLSPDILAASAGNLEVRHHSQGVDPGIGAAGAVEPRAAGKQLCQGRFHDCCTPVPIFCTCQPS